MKDSTIFERKVVWGKTDGRCYYCGKKLYLKRGTGRRLMTVDHFIPKSKGGSRFVENMVPACHPCNLRKGNLMPQEFRA